MSDTLTYNIDFALSERYRTVVLTTNQKIRDPILLKALKKDEGQYQTKKLIYRTTPIHAFELLKNLNGVQNLFFKNKRLICDFFSRLQVEYLAEKHTVHAMLGNRDLSEYTLILQGSPLIAIY